MCCAIGVKLLHDQSSGNTNTLTKRCATENVASAVST